MFIVFESSAERVVSERATASLTEKFQYSTSVNLALKNSGFIVRFIAQNSLRQSLRV